MKPSSTAGGTTTAGRVLNTPKLTYNEMPVVLNASQKNGALGLDLMQNCDLPPPVKVFAGSDNKTVLSSMNRAFGLMGTREDESRIEFDDGENHEKLELLKALRYSQTRAREAENKAELLAKERDCLSNAMFEDARKLFGHRQLVRLLELQVSCMYTKRAEEEKNLHLNRDHEEDNGDADDHGVYLTWVVALAFCFGIAGVGFALGCRYLY